MQHTEYIMLIKQPNVSEIERQLFSTVSKYIEMHHVKRYLRAYIESGGLDLPAYPYN